MISPFREDFRENKTLAKISGFTVFSVGISYYHLCGLDCFVFKKLTPEFIFLNFMYAVSSKSDGSAAGSVVECLTRDQEAAGSSLTGVTALWSLSKTHLS